MNNANKQLRIELNCRPEHTVFREYNQQLEVNRCSLYHKLQLEVRRLFVSMDIFVSIDIFVSLMLYLYNTIFNFGNKNSNSMIIYPDQKLLCTTIILLYSVVLCKV